MGVSHDKNQRKRFIRKILTRLTRDPTLCEYGFSDEVEKWTCIEPHDFKLTKGH